MYQHYINIISTLSQYVYIYISRYINILLRCQHVWTYINKYQHRITYCQHYQHISTYIKIYQYVYIYIYILTYIYHHISIYIKISQWMIPSGYFPSLREVSSLLTIHAPQDTRGRQLVPSLDCAEKP